MKIMIQIATIAIFLAPALASAEEKGELAFNCFNRAEPADAPRVSVLRDVDGNYSVELENRGRKSEVAVEEARTFTSATVYEGEGVTLTIAKVATQGATVELKGLDLTYQCKAAE
jgi:hypothetical protein